jgi:hypothetical protein
MRMTTVRGLVRGLVLGAAGLAAAGCTAGIVQKEDMLIAAGFQYRAADTPERVAALQRLPAHRFVHQERNGRGFWVYADPTVCRCVYAGSDAAFSNYQQAVFAQRLSDQNLMAAQINRDAVLDQYALGPWGPWAPFYY